MSCFIIAEAGVNHNGKVDLAKKLIEVAAKAGADAVKFQTFRAEDLVTPSAAKAEYQQQQTGSGSQFDMLKALELDEAAHQELLAHCKANHIEFMSTAFSNDSLDFLLKLGMQRIKIPSGELTNHPFIQYIASKDLPIIMSTGMADLEEVEEAINVIREERKNRKFTAPIDKILTILHCTSNYPAAFKDINLRAMQLMAKTFQLPVGYSDHTQGILIPPIAATMGATVIEKHFTLDKNLEGPDHQASLEPHELQQMITNIHQVELCLGNGIKQPRGDELSVRDLVRRSVTLKVAKQKDSKILMQDLCLLRPGIGIAPKSLHAVIGKTLNKDLPAQTTLLWEYLED